MSEKLVIIGSGGHARSVIDSVMDGNEFDVIGVLSPKVSEWTPYRGVSRIGTDSDARIVHESGCKYAALGIGFLGGPTDLFQELCAYYRATGFAFPPIVDPTAVVSKGSTIAAGVFVGKNAIVNVGSNVEECSVINSGALVEHDCFVGAFSHIAGNAVLCGGVSVGRGVFVGANATVIQELHIHDSAIVGAASLVLKDVPVGARALGIYKGEE